MSYFILDIETKPDADLIETYKANVKPDGKLKDPIKIEKDILKKQDEYRKAMSVDMDLCDIICIGIKEVKEDPDLYSLKEMEVWFKDFFSDSGHKIVTFNGKSFDIPIIIKCGIKQGLDLPYKNLYAMTERFKDNGHIDLMQLLSFGGTFGKFKSLDAYLRIYLGTQKETLGDDFFATATEDEIKEHCLEDLQFTEDLLKKFRFLL